jgi:hypothetical protein
VPESAASFLGLGDSVGASAAFFDAAGAFGERLEVAVVLGGAHAHGSEEDSWS